MNRERLSVSNEGKTCWMIIDEAFDAEKSIEFLTVLIKDAGKKVFLILDNLWVYHRKLVKAWVAEHSEKIELLVCSVTACSSILKSGSMLI